MTRARTIGGVRANQRAALDDRAVRLNRFTDILDDLYLGDIAILGGSINRLGLKREDFARTIVIAGKLACQR